MMSMLVNGNALHLPLADQSVQCVVTSPPYWGLRDYGTARWEGGYPDCDHVADPNATKKFGNPEFNKNRPSREKTKTAGYYKDVCPKCGASRADDQLGLEPTPELYVEHLVQVFREVWRVLRDDGVVWLNLGDSYAGSGKGLGADGTVYSGEKQRTSRAWGIDRGKRNLPRWGGGNLPATDGLKPKDLVGIPWRVALALQADGWWLRSDVIWNKLNPMTESVTDRPTKAHEYVFLLSKSARYFYDADAVKEPTADGTAYRNRRTVWTIAAAPYSGAHFATYPPALVEPCIKAGSRKGDVIFDPFNGAGTTGVVAQRLGRRYVGVDLSLEYLHLARERLGMTALEQWQNGRQAASNLAGLPLFGTS